MTKKIAIIFSIFIGACASYQDMPTNKLIKTAVVGHVPDDIDASFMGTTIFQNQRYTDNMGWKLTEILSDFIKRELTSKGYEDVVNLSAEPQYSVELPVMLENHGFGAVLSENGHHIINDLRREGYGLVFILSEGRTFLTQESSIDGRGLLVKKGIPYVYGGLSLTPIVIGETVGPADGTYAGCPEEYWHVKYALSPVEPLPEGEKYLTTKAIESYKDQIVEAMKRDIKSSLCYYTKS